MGGKGSGGRRPGSGRKPTDRHLRAIQGGVSRAAIAPPTTNGTSPVEEFDAPDDLDHEERAVWLKLAPHAFKNRTLTRATAYSFELLCRNVVLERQLSTGAARGAADHRGMIQRVNAGMLQFMLTPCGKPIFEAQDEQKPANPLDRFLRRAK